MKFIADFHLHSKYSRATSPRMDLENLDKIAKTKGIKVLTIGDFTHPEWFKNLKEKEEFQIPSFCLADVTQENFVAGGLNCGRSYDDILEELNKFGYQRL